MKEPIASRAVAAYVQEIPIRQSELGSHCTWVCAEFLGGRIVDVQTVPSRNPKLPVRIFKDTVDIVVYDGRWICGVISKNLERISIETIQP